LLRDCFLGHRKEAIMKAIRDPERAELSHLLKACDIRGEKVLEIGCGNGKFTRQYANEPTMVVGIDPDRTDLLEALKNRGSSNCYFIQTMGEKLPFSSRTYDIVIFASSL
jgi:ubiquinone/menaquinone biosynthesis C-methylase UbiE